MILNSLCCTKKTKIKKTKILLSFEALLMLGIFILIVNYIAYLYIFSSCTLVVLCKSQKISGDSIIEFL